MESLKMFPVILLTISSSIVASSVTNTYKWPIPPLPTSYTCDKHPAICTAAPGSITPNCCNKTCVNVNTDDANCGKCKHQCEAGEQCCKGTCVDILENLSNCGKCGYPCLNTDRCCRGKCVNLLTDIFNCGECGRKCERGQGCCDGKIVDLLNHKNHCGDCNTKCTGKDGKCYKGMCDYA